MKTTHILHIIISLALLAGCSSSGTKHPSQLPKIAQINSTHCYNEDVETLTNRLNEFLQTCYVASKFSSNTIKIGDIPLGTRISLNTGSAYPYSAELRAGINDCKTEAKMYGIDKGWSEALYQSNLAAYGKAYECP
ncbi:MAG: hypothetical protein OQK98_04560 [Gammaproteobacteria bacterium]|nr:hypothetical protein [Gammaproteobacteria bacterium]